MTEARPTQARPTSKWPMWVLGLVVMMDATDQSIVRGVVPQLKSAFHIGDLAVGVLMSAFVLVNGFVTVPAGYLADRWHRARTIGTTVIGWSAITALTAVSPNYGFMLGIRSLLGFGQALTEPSAGSLISDLYPLERRGRAFAIQQALPFVGFGLGVGLGGAVATTLGWRYAFLIVGAPGIFIALAAMRLREPRRGWSDRVHVGVAEDHDEPAPRVDLLANGVWSFVRDMVDGLRQDFKTIIAIPTMRYALAGIASLLFTLTAVSAWLPEFYERQLHLSNKAATSWFALLAIGGGVPGILLGGWVADHIAPRLRGGRVAVPAYCILIGAGLFTISYLDVPFGPCFALEMLGLFVMALSIAGLRAGFSDAMPAHLRGTGFAAFSLVSVVCGTAAAPFAVSLFSQLFSDNLRTAFLIVTPPVLLGGFLLLRAREHLDRDAAKIFAAVLAAVQAEQERVEQDKAERETAVVDLRESAGRDGDGEAEPGIADLEQITLDHDGDVGADEQGQVGQREVLTHPDV